MTSHSIYNPLNKSTIHFMDKLTALVFTIPPSQIIAEVVKDSDRRPVLNAYADDIVMCYSMMTLSERNALINLVEFEYSQRGLSWIQEVLSRHKR